MATFDIDGDLVRKLAGLLDETGLTEIEFAEGEKRIRVTKGGTAPAFYAQAPAAGAASAAAATTSPPAALGVSSHPGALTSPMVGTAYVSSEPGGPPFVRVGDTVKAGQTVLIIEAMKVMNPIKAPKAGTIAQVLVGDAQPVEFGEVLLTIE
ncbi:acetyl-CoA carboxylase biotin carboxyl carrier protein [Skermanella aerolata]|uniref:Biotin carboxyl carrier protein of acetyl-CoA carboxylase n=1 Tax=Skermanella aerolata TaxID=393310 RepID=A0A512DJ31_9PROT|nr:acetyl-CoA carboxylase biotin carboxyl carrier protein [Skermanella aerolata]KJB97333.1 acetyl-CoA carboxylase [Skermanella aerolata KACC 11604]GEO36497.1 acetyl-CoA carboxylase biotin carboxyl carrier protein subunit [Skermanella aerolata]